MDNVTLTAEMCQVKAGEDTDHGYHQMTTHLKLRGYQINKKKVYRLMKEADLLSKEWHVGMER